MKEIKKLYEKNENISEYFRSAYNLEYNTTSSILVSYDLQSGSYENTIINNITGNYYFNGKKIQMGAYDAQKCISKYIAKEINSFEYESVLEAGVGECSTSAFLIPELKSNFMGFDISASRIMIGNNVLNKNNITNSSLFVGDLNSIPLLNNSVDIIYTVHAIEPNTKNASEIIKQLYEVCSKYLILIEPSYELGNQETRDNIDKHKYIKNLIGIINKLDYKVEKYELAPISSYSNQSAIIIIKKESDLPPRKICKL